MKKYLIITILLSIGMVMCKKDDVVNDPTPPSISLKRSVISTAPKDLFWMEAEVTDDVGLKNINLLYSDWHLDRTIDLTDSSRTSYDLLYQFRVPTEAGDGPHTILVTAEDVGGNRTSQELTVKLNKDISAPEFVKIQPANGTPVKSGDPLNFFIEVIDDRGIDTFSIKAPDFGIDTIRVFDPANPRYIYVNNTMVDDSMKVGTYYVTMQASDTTGNKTSELLMINVIESIETVYLVGGATFNGWNEGNPMPMRKDESNEGWFEINTYSWGTENNNGIKFLGQKGWTPFNWGLDPSDDTKIVNSESSEKIILPDAGYYKVRFNPDLLEYSTEKQEATTELRSEMYIMGYGYVGYDLNWDPAQGIPMTRDLNNPYIFTVELEFSEWVDLKFLGQADGWGPFDCGWEWGERPSELGDVSRDLVVGDGTTDLKFLEMQGTYTIKMDYHILHGSVTENTE